MSNTETRNVIEIPDFLTVRELASLMQVSPIDVIKELMANGIMANINQQIDSDTAAIVASEFDFEAQRPAVVVEEVEEVGQRPMWRKILAEEQAADLKPRPPVITMLGHVDHGKTSLLDLIRHTNVQAGEAGGITQHIGAYQVEHDGQLITFLDTPGHEAFTAMRARGAQATDIAILVVAADDGVMPQTREAADHARAAQVPIVVALNKIDLPNANPAAVKQQLADIGLVPDDWDGDTLVIEVSARENWGIDDLLEAILLVAEEINPAPIPTPRRPDVLKRAWNAARFCRHPSGPERHAPHRRHALTTVWAIRSMFDYRGNRIKEAGPSTPVSVSGLNGLPAAGDQFEVVENEKVARKIAAERQLEAGGGETERRGISLDEFFNRLQEGETKTLNLIVKADVQGSLEPLVTSLEKLNTDNEAVELEILHASTGNITESDIMLASASDAVVLGFNVDVDTAARLTATNENVRSSSNVIYKLLEEVELAMRGLLGPSYRETIIGRAEVRAVFQISGVGTVAGCFMRTGVARRNAQARIIRNTQLLHTGPVSSLKHLQENVREVRTGFEFGVSIGGFSDYQAGDIIEFFEIQRVEPA